MLIASCLATVPTFSVVACRSVKTRYVDPPPEVREPPTFLLVLAGTLDILQARPAMSHRRSKVVGELLAAVMLLSSMVASGSSERADRLARNALQLRADAARGAEVYQRHCAQCHGVDAHGDAGALIPALAGQRQGYLVKQFADFFELERDSDAMHRVVAKAPLNEPSIWADVSTYLTNLPPARVVEVAGTGRAGLGELIFQEQCSSCHKSDARGDDDGFAPSLRNQHYSYLVEQIRGLAMSHRKNVDPNLVRFLDSLAADEVDAIADYLSRLNDDVRPHEP
jgi:cytochrome c553